MTLLDAKADNKAPNGVVSMFGMIGGALIMIAAAFGLAHLLSVPIATTLNPTPLSVLIGVFATAPLCAALLWFMGADYKPVVRFRESQLEFFRSLNLEFTPARILLLSTAAGVSEELLFRGVLQTWLTGKSNIFVALILTNIVFGLLHFRTIAYVVIAGLVGVYLGVVFYLVGDLTAPIITHALYDVAALGLTARALAAHETGERKF